MNQLYDIYAKVKYFADNSSIVQSFHLINSPEEIDTLDSEFPRLIMIPDGFEILDGYYNVSYGIIAQDAVVEKNYMMEIQSYEMNVNIIGQLEDYLFNEGKNTEISTGQFAPSFVDARNRTVTTAYATMTATVDRIPSDSIEWKTDLGD
jgi:hypothetical protein